jgi:hypothetical protein
VKTRAEKTGRNISKNTTIKFLHNIPAFKQKFFVEGVKQITKQKILIIKSKRLCLVKRKRHKVATQKKKKERANRHKRKK